MRAIKRIKEFIYASCVLLKASFTLLGSYGVRDFVPFLLK
jgi:hypothetical protein